MSENKDVEQNNPSPLGFTEELSGIIKSLDNPQQTKASDPLLEQRVENLQSDRGLKRRYANWFIGILIGQLLLMNLCFFAVGLGWLEFSEWSLNLFMGGTLAEVFGVILVITKNLFSSCDD